MRAVVLLLLLLVLAGCSKRDIPSSKAIPVLAAWVKVTGVSMSPTHPSDVFVEALVGFPFEQLKIGDSVIFWDYTKTAPSLTHHRIVGEQLGNFIVRGDNPVTNTRADRPWLTKDNYIAKTSGKWAYTVK